MAVRRIGLAVHRPTATAGIDALIRADERGVEMVWSTSGGMGPDAITTFAAAATRARRITFGTSIVPIYPRHPSVLAAQAVAMADLAPERFRLGIGPSHQPMMEGVLGITFAKPLLYLREYLTILRQLLWSGRAEFAGEFFTIHGLSLPAERTPPRTPLLISALRPNAFRLAGEIADGAISWMCPVPYLLQTALPALQAGAAAAHRAAPPLVTHVPVAVHQDRAAVRHAARQRLGIYGRLPFYVKMFADAGYPVGDDGVLPDALLDEVVVSGDQEQVATQLADLQATGLDELLLLPIPVSDADAEELALIEAITRS